MVLFFKKNWKRIALGVVLLVVIVVGLLAFRVVNFIGSATANRIGGNATPTVDAQAMVDATATAQTRACAVSISCNTPVAVTPGGTVSPVSPNSIQPTAVLPLPSPTPNLSNSKILQRIQAGDRISVLYLGYGGSGHEGEYLTDSLMVLSFDPKTQTVTEFNVPRDLYVSVPGGPNGQTWESKINGVYSTIMKWGKPTQDDLDPRYHWTNPQEQQQSAANLTTNTVETILGFKIDYWVAMNFNGFRKLIDNMGGVNVCVDRAFEDDEYPTNDDDNVDASVMTIKFATGCQMMTGERAIEFARSRKSNSLEGGDFARSARQMKVVQAIKDQVLHSNLFTNALSYMDALQGNLLISMSPDELFSMANYFNSADGKALATKVHFDPEIMTGNNFLQDTDKGGDVGYALIPQLGQDKYKDIQSWVQHDFTYALIRREQATLQVLNATGTPGRSNNLTNFLDDQGFRQAEADTAPNEDQTFLMDYTNGAATANLAQLKQFLPNMPIYNKTADKKPYEGAPDLMLFIGKDYKGVNTDTTSVNSTTGLNPTPQP